MWLRANKISLNTSKTEIVLFRSKRKTITKKLNFRISGQNIPISKSVKYLGVMLNENLSWDSHMAYILPKLNRGLGLLSKIRYYVPMRYYDLRINITTRPDTQLETVSN